MNDLWARIWAKTDRTGECWAWTGARDGDGYGLISVGGVHRKATRVVWRMTRGTLPDDVMVLHTCDNPPCVRPTHLFTGDQRLNMQDAAQKGRLSIHAGHMKGDRHPNTKIPEADIPVVRARYLAGEKRSDLAKEYGVTYQTIWRVATGRER